MTSPELRPTPGGRLVVLDGSRLAGLKDWRALASVAGLACAAGANDGVLLDVRQAPFTPAAGDAEMLAVALSGYPAVAIVCGGNASFGCARMVSTLVELRGSRAAAFLTKDVAEVWLSQQVGRELDGSAAAPEQALV